MLIFEVAVITPPMGINVLALQSITSEISLAVMFKGVGWFLMVMFLFVALMIAFPDIALLLCPESFPELEQETRRIAECKRTTTL